jgi:hypothetical protein
MAALLRACALVLLAVPHAAHNWTYEHGALRAGNDLQKGNHTLSDARTICESLSGCIGFTYNSIDANLTEVAQIYFKKGGFVNGDNSWSSYLQDYTPLPKQGVDVFVSGTENYPTFRIPAILAMDNGDLLVFAEGRHGGDHGWNDIGKYRYRGLTLMVTRILLCGLSTATYMTYYVV